MTIRELRDRQKLSQAEFGKLIGVSQGTINNLEHSRMKVSQKLAEKIREVFGAEIETGEAGMPAEKPAEESAAKKTDGEKPAAKATGGKKTVAEKVAGDKPAEPKSGAEEIPKKTLAEGGQTAEPERKAEIYIQSPLGGNITPEQILTKLPAGAEAAFVRVDQNLIWWLRGDETGAVEIWANDP